ncbi:MAG: 8-oxo-dGTP diphosphatase MutT [Methyloceanibacter sp.]
MREGNKRRIVIVAACALVDGEGRLLITRRPAGKPLAGLWEFPGGKVETDEAPEAALIRELREELALEIAKDDLKPLTFASHAYPDFHLLMPVYLCRKWQGSVTPLEGQEILWVKPSELDAYDMPPADEPLKTALRDLL